LGQKCDVQLDAGFGFETFEGSASHHPFNLMNCSEQDAGLVAQQIAEPELNPLKNGCYVFLRRLKYNVAALDIGPHTLAPCGGKCVLQIAHAHNGIAAYIDGAQESDVLHFLSPYRKSRNAIKA
jgi:hypothetical protein